MKNAERTKLFLDLLLTIDNVLTEINSFCRIQGEIWHGLVSTCA